MESLFEINNQLAQLVSIQHVRSLSDKIDWDSRLIEIRGSRGVGKTTLMLQQVKKRYFGSPQTGLYASLDDPYFYSNSIIELADKFSKYGGEQLFLDEVHRYPPKHENSDWSSEVKIIYDRYPNLRVVYTGSSILSLFKGKGDLSRRRIVYHLPGLSFREYLALNNIYFYKAITLNDLLKKHELIAKEIVPHLKILKEFRDYLEFGYYPYHLEHAAMDKDKGHYYNQINDVLSLILETDIPAAITDFGFDKIVKIKKLLAAVSTTVPYTLQLIKVKNEIGVSDDRTLLKYLHYLNESAVITTLRKKAKGNAILRKPDKVYIENTNLMNVIARERVNAGNLRETFFLNQIKNNHKVYYPERGDFLVSDSSSLDYTFEVGGKNKGNSQIKDVSNAYLVLDNIEYGIGNKVPLWLFGFLY